MTSQKDTLAIDRRTGTRCYRASKVNIAQRKQQTKGANKCDKKKATYLCSLRMQALACPLQWVHVGINVHVCTGGRRGKRGAAVKGWAHNSHLWRSGVPSWKGRGPSAVDSTPPGAAPKYPDPGQQGNDLSRSRGDWIRSGAGLFPSGFPSPPTTCLNFSLWRDLSVWRICGGYFGPRRSVWEGFIDSGDAVPVAV